MKKFRIRTDGNKFRVETYNEFKLLWIRFGFWSLSTGQHYGGAYYRSLSPIYNFLSEARADVQAREKLEVAKEVGWSTIYETPDKENT